MRPRIKAATTEIPAIHKATTAFGCPRDFQDRKYVYTVISPRAKGLSIGVNLNPTGYCNFDCLYCEVPHRPQAAEAPVNVEQMTEELKEVMTMVSSGSLMRLSFYSQLPASLLELKHISLSGDGEPTLSPNFLEVVQSLVHFRALRMFPFFKLVLITNGTQLSSNQVVQGIDLLEDSQDEVWIKLDTGSQERFERVNRYQGKLDDVMKKIIGIAKSRPVVLQSLQMSIGGVGPSEEEIDALAERVLELKHAGAKISEIQIYSATRPVWNTEVGHLKLKALSVVAHTIQRKSGIKALVY